MTDRQITSIDVRILLLRGSDVLLIQRSDQLFNGYWNLPGGHVVAAEDALTAAGRELEEETGVTVKPFQLRFVGACHYRITDRGPKVGLAFAAQRWTGIPHVNEPDKFSAAAWHPIHALPNPLMPQARELLRMYYAGAMFSVYGWETDLPVGCTVSSWYRTS